MIITATMNRRQPAELAILWRLVYGAIGGADCGIHRTTTVASDRPWNKASQAYDIWERPAKLTTSGSYSDGEEGVKDRAH